MTIKTLAVRQENTIVARATLHNMRQDQDETIRSFEARIKGQAGICKYTTTCPPDTSIADIDYTDAILRDVLVRGIADQDIQPDLLGDQNHNNVRISTWPLRFVGRSMHLPCFQQKCVNLACCSPNNTIIDIASEAVRKEEVSGHDFANATR